MPWHGCVGCWTAHARNARVAHTPPWARAHTGTHLTKPLCRGRPNACSPGPLKHSARNMPRLMQADDCDSGSLCVCAWHVRDGRWWWQCGSQVRAGNPTVARGTPHYTQHADTARARAPTQADANPANTHTGRRQPSVRTHTGRQAHLRTAACCCSDAPLGRSHVHTWPLSSPGSASAAGSVAMLMVRRPQACRNVRTWHVTPSPQPGTCARLA